MNLRNLGEGTGDAAVINGYCVSECSDGNGCHTPTCRASRGGFSPHLHHAPVPSSPSPHTRGAAHTSQDRTKAATKTVRNGGHSTCEESDQEKRSRVKCSTVAVLIDRYNNPAKQHLNKLTFSRMSMLRPRRQQHKADTMPAVTLPPPPHTIVTVGRTTPTNTGSNKENKKHRSRVHVGGGDSLPPAPGGVVAGPSRPSKPPPSA
ncbi:hypothetical protein Hamer_G026214 [Homarus americanus]|uniref:Uncharacterized protein n=1 Tax=Homarus americanus TaxID=6706 RepID=A0A8J5J6Q9_HOMAM|nr:hypothetical protein Hamer_G026214 [Homarus americanus]